MIGDRQHILVVDDQVDIAEMTSAVLRGEGYSASMAHNGRQALERIASNEFDLVLLDINMPEMDGWETLRLLRADDEWSKLPVVMFSVKSEVSDKVQSLKEGASGYVTKPFAVDKLIGSIRKLIGDPQPGRDLQEAKR